MEAFTNNNLYAEKGIDMWDQVWEIQETCTPEALLDNLHLLYGLSQGSSHETTNCLGNIHNLIYCCKSGGG